MPVWLQNEGAWIAIGVSVVFLIAAVVLHRVVMRVLKSPNPADQTAQRPAHNAGPAHHE